MLRNVLVLLLSSQYVTYSTSEADTGRVKESCTV